MNLEAGSFSGETKRDAPFELTAKGEKPAKYPKIFTRMLKANWNGVCKLMDWKADWKLFEKAKNPPGVVKAIQMRIGAANLPKFGVDGLFGPETTGALKLTLKEGPKPQSKANLQVKADLKKLADELTKSADTAKIKWDKLVKQGPYTGGNVEFVSGGMNASVNIGKMLISVAGKKAKLNLPSGASLSSVLFKGNGDILMKVNTGFFYIDKVIPASKLSSYLREISNKSSGSSIDLGSGASLLIS